MADLPAPQPRSLVDPGFDHDACGVGFMADTGRSAANRARVLPLALAGLAALGHRGAFAADGESSDGAGLLLPLEAPLRRLVGAPAGSAVVSLFLPQGRRRGRLARGIVGRSLAAEGLGRAVRRRVPVEPAALGQEARRSLPAVEQLVVPRPVGFGRRRFAQALLLAQRRMELGAAEAGLADFSVVSASAETLVYKGLVAGVRLAELYPDLAAPLALSHAVFHQRFATNTAPRWDLAQPFGRIAHNGEINTVRGNRAELRGRRADLGGRFGRRLTALGPLLDPRASDSRSLDELLAIMTAGGWSLPAALSAAIPEAVALRPDIALRADVAPRSDEATAPSASGSSASASSGAGERASWSGLLAPWDGPAAICFSDGRQVGALLDRSGLRPLSSTTTHAGLVGLASEAGAIPFTEAETAERGRLGPGQLLVVEPASGRILGEPAAPRRLAIAVPASPFEDRPTAALRALDARPPTPDPIRFLCGLDAERLRLDVRTMALEGHEPTWSMGDDTPLAGLGRPDRPLADHLRQSFAQVTNPALDPDRERIVMDLRVRLGPRPALLRGGRAETAAATVQLGRPIVADLAGLMEQLATGLELDATWDAAQGPGGLEAALDHLTRRALAAARRRVPLLVISDRGMTDGPSARLPIPSPLAVGAVHTALTEAGWRARTDILAQAADVLEVHGLAMALAAGATAVHPWLLLEVAAGQAGTRGAETLTPKAAVGNVLAALEAGLRKVLARMGIATAASYVGGACFEALELRPEVVARCFPAAPSWPGRIGFAEIAARQLWRCDAAAALPAGGTRLPDPGLARFRGDGETHLWAPRIVRAAQGLARGEVAAEAYRATLGRRPAVVRDGLAVRAAPQPVPLAEVEPAAAVARRFVGAAMSLGSLSPEAHQAVAIGLRAVGAASNTGEGGEDPGWYLPDAEGRRHDAAIKQVASARFGVTATYLARAEQLEIKIAQGSKPGEGGQLPGRKATPLIATLRRSQPGRTLISPPPHHDIYSIEDLAQLVADLRAVNPAARIGVKLVASRGVGTVAAGVAKADADYVQISGHAGGTGASPLSSIKHAGLPFELGLAEAHQVLLDHGLRDRVALRADGGLQTGRDVLVAALLGAEEFGFGTAVLVALGCDMARQCHLDTCPTGIATQRPDLRAKFAGRPEDVVRLLTAVAEDVRLELARAGFRSLGEAIGRADRLAPRAGATLDLRPLRAAPRWSAPAARRADPAAAARTVARAPASALETRLVAALEAWQPLPGEELAIGTADRSFGAALSGAIERDAMAGRVRREVELRLRGSAGQSFGAFAGPGLSLTLTGQANDYVAKGLSGGTVVVRPGAQLLARAERLAIAGNTCLYGATAGRLHLVGRAGMRFAVRNSGAEAVVEGVGPHACTYMTGGTVVILGPAGRNLAAGMTGGRIFLLDTGPVVLDGRRREAAPLEATRLADVAAAREDGPERLVELQRLLVAQARAGSPLAARLLERGLALAAAVWLIEPPAERLAAGSEAGAQPEPQPVRAAGRVEQAAPAEA